MSPYSISLKLTHYGSIRVTERWFVTDDHSREVDGPFKFRTNAVKHADRLNEAYRRGFEDGRASK